MTHQDVNQAQATPITAPDPFAPAAFLHRLEGFLRGQHGLGAVLGWTDAQLDTVELLGDRLLGAGRFAEARTLYEGLLALDPARAPVYCRLAICHHQAGHRAHAERCLTGARQLLGDTPELQAIRQLLGRSV